MDFMAESKQPSSPAPQSECSDLSNTSPLPTKDSPTSFMLKDLVQHYLAMAEFLLRRGSDNERRIGPVRALHATLVALKELYYLEGAPQLIEAERDWESLRDRIAVGMVKTTEEFGNTSVSMYLATIYLKTMPCGTHVGMMNCGNGGVKYQLYGKELTAEGKEVIKCVKEFKPGQEKNAKGFVQIDKLVCGNYQPKGGVNAAALKKALEIESTRAPWKEAGYSGDIKVYAFVTGQIRNDFEQQEYKEDERNAIHAELLEVFRDVALPISELPNTEKKLGFGFLLSADSEGFCEINGARVMYLQMNEKQGDAPGKKMKPIVSLGIGQESAQWAQHGGGTFCFPRGMNEPKVCELGLHIIRRYLEQPERFSTLCELVRGCSEREVPTIALKSGCLLVLANRDGCFDDERNALVDLSKNTVSLFVRGDAFQEALELEVPIGCTMTELCRRATTLFREKTKHKNVQFVFARDIKVVMPELDGKEISLCTLDDGERFGVPMKRQEVRTLEDLSDCITTDSWKNQGISPPIPFSSLPLSWSMDKWQLATEMWDNEQKLYKNEEKKGKISAFRGSWSFLQKLWMHPSVRWAKFRPDVRIGLWRSTPQDGNTSVAMGFAVNYLKAHEDHPVVALVNCGTGGVKIQVYTNLPSKRTPFKVPRVALLAESKPVTWKKAGEVKFSDLKVNCPNLPSFEYKGRGISADDLRHRLQRLLKDVPWKMGTWPERMKDVPTFAFITGRLRRYWESLPVEQADELRKYVNQVFEPCPCPKCSSSATSSSGGSTASTPASSPAQSVDDQPLRIHLAAPKPRFVVRPVSELLGSNVDNFFLSLEVEGQTEFVGVHTFNSQLTGGKEVVVGVVSIERSCSRMTMPVHGAKVTDPDAKRFIVTHKVPNAKEHFPGMDQGEKLHKLGSYIMRALLEPETLMENLINVVEEVIKNNHRPVIALKGGCVLLLEGKHGTKLCKELAARPPLSSAVHEEFALRLDPTLPETDIRLFVHDASVQLASLDCPQFCMQGLMRHVRFPISRARFCAMAYEWLSHFTSAAEEKAVLFVPEFHHIYVGRSRPLPVPTSNEEDDVVAQAAEYGKLQLVPLRGNLLTANDVNGRCLYFSYESCETRLDALIPRLAQVVGRGKYLYFERKYLLADARTFLDSCLNDGDDSAIAVQIADNQLEAYVAAAEAEAASGLADKAKFDSEHNYRCAPPPNRTQPISPAALASYDVDLPLGMYYLREQNGTLVEALSQQLDVLEEREVNLAGISSVEQLKEFMPLHMARYRLYVLNPPDGKSSSVDVFGEGAVSIVVLRRTTTEQRTTITCFYPVWSSRSAKDHTLWARLRPLLGLKIHLMESIGVFGKYWPEILEFKSMPGEVELIDQVRSRLKEMVTCHIQPTDESQGGRSPSPCETVEERPWYSHEDWPRLIDALERALGAGGHPDYKSEVGLAFQLALKDRLGQRQPSQLVEEQLATFYRTLEQKLEPDMFSRIVSHPTSLSNTSRTKSELAW